MKTRFYGDGVRRPLASGVAVATLLSALVGLAACGGSSSDGSSTDDSDSSGDGTYSGSSTYTSGTSLVDLGSSNATAAAGSSIDAASNGAFSGMRGSNAAGFARDSSETSLSLVQAIMEVGKQALERETRAGNHLVGATSNECPDGGSYSATYNTGSDDTLNSSGETISISFDSCESFSRPSEILDGTLKLTNENGDFSTADSAILVEATEFLIHGYTPTEVGIDGTLRLKSGSHAGTFPTGHDPSNTTLSGTAVDFRITLGADGNSLDVVNNSHDTEFRMTNVTTYYADNSGGDGTLNASDTWYWVVHGENPRPEICTGRLDGCVTINHSASTAFTFTTNNANQYDGYPNSGILRLDGNTGYVKINADNGEEQTVQVTGHDGTSGSSSKEDWTSISNEGLLLVNDG